MRLYTYITLICVTFLSCRQEQQQTTLKTNSNVPQEVTLQPNQYILKGTTFSDINTLFVYKTIDSTQVITDTITITNKAFTYKSALKTPELITIGTDSLNTFTLFADHSIIDVFLAEDIRESQYSSNSKLQQTYKTYNDFLHRFSNDKTELLNTFYTNNNITNAKILTLKNSLDRINTNEKAYIKNFITDNRSSLLSVLSLNKHLNRFSLPELRILNDTISDSLKLKYVSKTEAIAAYIDAKTKAATLAKAKTVDEYRVKAYDFSGTTPNGSVLSLASLPKGKVILLDFWAAWCGPCRATNPQLVQLQKKYKNKGLVIVNISEDRSEAEWVNAIAKDNLYWDEHIWDKNKSIAFRYGVDAIPHKVLIDKQGRIANDKFRGGNIEQRIEQLLNE